MTIIHTLFFINTYIKLSNQTFINNLLKGIIEPNNLKYVYIGTKP